MEQRMTCHFKSAALTLFATVILFTPALRARQITGEISGTVVDQTGARIANASTVITNTDMEPKLLK